MKSAPAPPPEQAPQHKGIIAWFAKNPVAANLLMIIIIGVGGFSAFNIQRSLQPALEINAITIDMVYPGAAPEEVEQGIIYKIEEALKDIDSIKKIEATAQESRASLNVEVYEDLDVLEVLDEVKSAVDAISSFPEEAEKPIIKHQRMRVNALIVQVFGDVDEAGLKDFAESVKTEMLSLPDIAAIDIFGDRDFEIAIEVPERTLREYQLTLEQVAQAIRRSSIDLPSGSLKTQNGDIMLRAQGQAYGQYDFEKIVLLTYPDGTRLTLGDIATIKDGFVESDVFSEFDGRKSFNLSVDAIGNQDAIAVASAAKQYVKKKQAELPPGLHIDYWADTSYYLEGRLDMMLKNIALGALLVFVILSLFLEIKLAFWVMAGLPICFLGTFIFMPLEFIDISLNMISLFGFLLILGIVVDDAIIIGESAYSTTEEKGHSVDNVIEGALRVATPATFGVLTTIVAFLPTILADGIFAPFPEAMGWVVILCLIFSLVESKWILPAHLAHSRSSNHGIWGYLNKFPAANNRRLEAFVDNFYMPFLLRCIRNRYTTLAVFISMLILVAGMVAGGIVRVVVFPSLPGDFLRASLEMMEGTPKEQTDKAHQHLLDTLYELEDEYKADSGNELGLVHHQFAWGWDNRFSRIMLELTKSEERSINTVEIANRWREKVGDIAGAKILSISNFEEMGGPAIAFKIIGQDFDQLKTVSNQLAEKLANYDGVFDIRNGASNVQDEIKLKIKPGAEALGISLADLGTQVRHAFYGAEAQRLQRGNNEIKVMVRYPKADRETMANLENMYIRTKDGDEVPFSSVAEVSIEPGFDKMSRINSQRAIKVTAQMDKQVAEPSSVVADIEAHFMKDMMARYPGISYKLDGESEEAGKLLTSLFTGFAIALFGIYALLAIPLKSYMQPLIIMGVIPFGIIGAVIGHIVIGITVDMMSLFGIVALSGVVVNDSLIMVDFVNKNTAKGMPKFEAILNSGRKRFRAILITSLTTFFGLLPMLLEHSLQAQQVIPMAVSLGFGIIFATVITLLLVPCLYIILDDFDIFVGKKDKTQEIQLSTVSIDDREKQVNPV